MNKRIKSLLSPIGKTAAALLAGTAILISAAPAFAATDYTAKDGDTLWSLSQKFDVPLNKLMALNENLDSSNIYKGVTLSIPAASTASASTTGVQLLPKDDGMQVVAPNGTSYKVSKTLTVKASAYSAAASENGKWGAVDYFGNPLKLGSVAVDPKQIPLGTKLYISGYNSAGLPEDGMIATAADTGGAINGNRIDIFVPGSAAVAQKFGFQNVKVLVLK